MLGELSEEIITGIFFKLTCRQVSLQRKGVIIIGGGCFSISGAIK